ncbi:family 78 glycoside hydrolase catalytic domain [Aliiglaciecola sp. LCG003]|uniref:family 78 glycoside hydrolase catalytic domain n=1 Tax=Aliiglaciecola sp. LCG003 TaxID=3053655 RepID=UPI0025736FC5|nr:family 78 glycoside hydrolase catalytic domain [Aliiglaciecola sp. LCG003]WJG09683.1 family 78 glycoside hydrolase catalytic domain [Aliiglaciecola sp. LCG003]
MTYTSMTPTQAHITRLFDHVIKKRLQRIFFSRFSFVLILFVSAYSEAQSEKVVGHYGNTSPTSLEVEYRQTPMGIDVVLPRFSWQMATQHQARGQKQQAYRVVVEDERGDIAWDSSKITDASSLHITYAGKPLKPSTKYRWSVSVWDQNENVSQASSWFETGLMNSDIGAWDTAEWIGGGNDSLPLYADYLPLYDLAVEMSIATGSERAAIILAANDPRFLDKYKNIYQVQNELNESYFKVEIDITGLENADGHALLNFYRAGYTLSDTANKPVAQFKINTSVINNSNKHDFHHLLIHNEYGTLTVQLDHNSDFYLDATKSSGLDVMFPPLVRGAKVTLNPAGVNHDVLTYGMLNQIGFSVNARQVANFKNLQINNIHQPKASLFSEDLAAPYTGIFIEHLDEKYFSIKNGSYVLAGETSGAFIVADPSQHAMPMLRSEFKLADKNIAKARLYVTARGIYEFYINGQRISNDYYNPGLTQYNLTHLYQTYDVSSSIKSGENAMGALLAEGWWSGLMSFGNTWNSFGDRQSLLAKLVVSYQDGTQEVFTTDDKHWQFFNDGPTSYGSLAMGEVYDARKEQSLSGWSEAGFVATGWQQAEVVTLKGSATQGAKPNMSRKAQHLNYDDMQLVGQIGQPASVFKVLTAQSVQEVRPGVFVYDLGQNIVGVPRIDFAQGKEGQVITLRFAEMLYPDLPDSGPNVGMIMTENYRAALSQDIYIMKEGKQQYQPRFTSHGFQYIEITGINKALPLEAVEGIAISSITELTAGYETSNSKVNKLWSNLVWSNVDNFLSVPTDCPQRNERMGWSGDINVFGRTATYVSDSSQFLRRHLQAMRDTQATNGRFADIAPVGGGFGGILWGSAGITLPWEAYWQFGDLGLLKEHYSAMAAYMAYLDTTIDPKTGITNDAGLGDWLGPQNQQLGSAFLATAYHIYTLDIMAKVADILGEIEDAAGYKIRYKERKAFFNNTFVSQDGKTIGLVTYGSVFAPSEKAPEYKVADTQTSYAVGLALGAFDQKYKTQMANNLKTTVARTNLDDSGTKLNEYSLMTGFIGTAWIADALSENSFSATAYKLIQNESYPSWLYSVTQGATTIWERLNGYTEENGFGGNNGMNSFNHYSFGAVGQWMMGYSAGIQRDAPGYKTFFLKPQIDGDGGIDNVKAFYDSAYGKIESHWSIAGNKLHYEATVPANTSATLYLPAANASTITEGGDSLADSKGVSEIAEKAGVVSMQLQSGHYRFISDLPH